MMGYVGKTKKRARGFLGSTFTHRQAYCLGQFGICVITIVLNSIDGANAGARIFQPRLIGQ